MITCPVCKSREFHGTTFCSECGTLLAHDPAVSTIKIPRDQIQEWPGGIREDQAQEPELKTGAMGGLRVISTGDVLSLVGRDLFTLGRIVKGQAVIPDIDLDPFDASKAGVSRIHAELIIQSDGLYIKDLESANGTFVNGDRIPSQSPVLIQNADILQLGRLRLQLISH
ncbi:MAG: FHA domain-containing protein [Anaerolineales bacterium]|jgi:hypothetical protein